MKSYFSVLKWSALAVLVVLAVPASIKAVQSSPQGYEQLKAEAERLFADKSFAKANEAYRRADVMDLPPTEARWVDFRLADTSWRSQAGTNTNDSSVFEAAQKQLEELLRKVEREEDRDLVWAEASESMGDYWWARQNSQNWGGAWPHYQNALDWWAGSSDLEKARDRYLNLVWSMAEPSWMDRGNPWHYGYIPLNVLDNALKIAATPNDKARASYLVAMTLLRSGDWAQHLRLPKAFEAAIKPGKTTEWYDDALYTYAEYLANTGVAMLRPDGHWTRRHDYPKALELFQRLIREHRKGETRYFDQAEQMIASITGPVLNASVTNTFLPGSEIQYQLGWRNVRQIELSLHKVDLNRDVNFASGRRGLEDLLRNMNLGAAEKIKTWTKDTQDKGDYEPGQSQEKLEEPLPPGAYLLTATAGGKTVHDLILVTNAAVILKNAGDQALAFACDAMTSKPIAQAQVKMWKLAYDNDRWHVSSATKTADDSGLCVFGKDDFKGLPSENNVQYLATISKDDRQALATTNRGWFERHNDGWRIYTFTDRPAYRPGDTVNWKLIARTPSNAGFVTPADASIHYEITDPRGAKLKGESAKLNAFGSAWGSLELNDTMPLGEYQVTYWSDAKHERHIGNATLFRLEEYKLPEFQVAIFVPEENGRKKAFILGEQVTATIQADYYFGGPVANASVEVVVHQNPYYHWWQWPREFSWCYEDPNPYRWWGGQGPQIKRETIKTDSTGKATLTFDTPGNDQQDYDYRIEARVIDASRREITASDSVRVTKQRYYVYSRADHNIFRPNDAVKINFQAQDANEQPVPTEGTVKVTREQWIEIWTDPVGKEFTGPALQQMRDRSMIWPPEPPLGTIPWRLKFQGYKSEDILTTTVKLNDKGEGDMTFTPSEEGYYRIAWRSEATPGGDAPPLTSTGLPITSETYAWVADTNTTRLGYRTGGVEIIVDKDTFRAGQTAPVMINTPTNDRYVLFSVEGNDLYSYQVVHVTGNVKLVQLPIDQRHVPNIYLNAALAHDAQLYFDREEVVVPPVEQYLNVEVLADRSQYQPGEEGQFTVVTKDHDGKPVSAEVALSVFDEAVAYIQQDYAGDPRPYFFEQRQQQIVQTGSSFQQKAYIRLAKGENEELIDATLIASNEIRSKDDRDGDSYDFGGEGGALEGRREMSKARGMAGAGGGRAPGAPMATGAPAPAMEADSFLRQSFNGLADEAEMKLGMNVAMQAGQEPGMPGGEPAVQVRSDFRATLLWKPDVVTDEDGTARVTLKYGDSLTAWVAKARAAGKGNQFGMGSATTRTKMPLIARLQAPRFFLVGDTVTISGVINNNTEEEQTVTPELVADGLTLVGLIKDGQPTKGDGTTVIAANSEARIDWQVQVEKPGSAKIKLTAKSSKYADSMEKSFTIFEHGVERLVAKSGKVRGNEVTVKLDIPSERKIDSTVLAVQVSPSMAVTMLDALPYLIDYPYGCTEQTMSRFLPAAITAKTLRDLGLKPEDAMAKVFGGIEQATVDKTHPKGKRDLAQMQDITNASLARLYDFQHSDGGWGWWKEGDSDHFMTAYVLWGLCLAQQAEMDVKQDVIDRAADWLDKELVELETSYDMQAWMLHALATHHELKGHKGVGEFQGKAMTNLWNNREKLNAYTRALTALAAHHFGDDARAKTLVENLENGVKRDERPDTSVIVKGVQGPNEAVMGTAHWGEDGVWWRWSDGGVEATAFALRAILAIDPKNKLVEPVTNWLIKNRRGAQWSNTRDTAIVVLTMNDYLRASGELSSNLEYELLVNGTSITTRKITSTDILGAPSRFDIDRNLIRNGDNDIRIVRKGGDGPIYFSAEAEFFSLEEPVPAGGNEIFVRREYFKLVPRPTLLKGYVYDRLPLPDGGNVSSGERVEVVMTIEAKNNYEYLVFEDLKPAGLEAVAVRSGEPLYTRQMKSSGIQRAFGDGRENDADIAAELAHADAADYTGQQRGVYQELRDRKVAMFIDHLPEGVWEIRYDLRAETPGRFHALPVMGHAMYVPEIKCNSAEVRLTVTDRSDE